MNLDWAALFAVDNIVSIIMLVAVIFLMIIILKYIENKKDKEELIGVKVNEPKV